MNIKIYVYGITALNGYIIPLTNSFLMLLITVLIIAAIGSIATFTWAFGGLKLQKIYSNYYKFINWILGLSLLYFVWSMF